MPNFPSSDNSQATLEARFNAAHFAPVGFMIIAKQMKDSVKGKNLELVFEAASESARVAPRDNWRNGDVSQK
jgi:hypothetical protein